MATRPKLYHINTTLFPEEVDNEMPFHRTGYDGNDLHSFKRRRWYTSECIKHAFAITNRHILTISQKRPDFQSCCYPAINPLRTAVPFGDKLLEIRLVCPRNGTSVLKGVNIMCRDTESSTKIATSQREEETFSLRDGFFWCCSFLFCNNGVVYQVFLLLHVGLQVF